MTHKPLTILMITVGLVLLIACVNVANYCWRGVSRAGGRSGFAWPSVLLVARWSCKC
jgi:hypothetical protein